MAEPGRVRPGSAPYLDTSALAKWYLNEDFSDEVEAYLQALPRAIISSLTVVEMRSLLARRRRAGELNDAQERQCWALFDEDRLRGHLEVLPLRDEHAQGAVRLMNLLPRHPLRTLDALHLAVARAAGLEELATADRGMAEAAEALGLQVRAFVS